jgi:hypothetical protein
MLIAIDVKTSQEVARKMIRTCTTPARQVERDGARCAIQYVDRRPIILSQNKPDIYLYFKWDQEVYCSS